MRRTRALALGLVAAALVVSLAACGGDDEDSAVSGITTETTTDTTTDETATTETTDTGGAPAGGGTLSGTVGPAFEISVWTTGTVAPGSYELTVEDQSSAHNFHLTGPGVDVSTSVSGEGPETFPIDLEPGTYEFMCDPHAFSMNGSFEVAS
ncbi:MAG: cupredoxin domain-containing protein [Gaiellaceae bacterium]